MFFSIVLSAPFLYAHKPQYHRLTLTGLLRNTKGYSKTIVVDWSLSTTPSAAERVLLLPTEYSQNTGQIWKNRSIFVLGKIVLLTLFCILKGLPQGTFKRFSSTQGDRTTVFCKTSVRRSKYCLEFSITWGRLLISICL